MVLLGDVYMCIACLDSRVVICSGCGEHGGASLYTLAGFIAMGLNGCCTMVPLVLGSGVCIVLLYYIMLL